jgi:pSer/pThr/pTyr-binding forkhead associated (FHA) protein
VFQAVFIGALSSSNDIRFPVHTSSRQHNILYLGLDIGPLILHTNSRQGKNAPQILDSNSRQKKILVIESTVTNYESKIQ